MKILSMLLGPFTYAVFSHYLRRMLFSPAFVNVSVLCTISNKNSSEDEIANVNFLRRYGTYVLQNTKKENLLRLTN